MAKILVVDDTLFMRIKLTKILEESGHQVVGEAPNGRLAISLYEKLKPDLVTLDITMPEMNGIDALREIIKRDRKARVVMISALSQKPKVFQALALGAMHYIIKPFEKRLISQVVQKVLGEEANDQVEKKELKGTILNKIDQLEQKRALKPQQEEECPFIMQNREGTVVFLPSEFKGESLLTLCENLKTVHNPKVVINILSLPWISEFLFEQLVLAVERIKKNGGQVEVYALKEVLQNFEGKQGYNLLMGEINQYF